MDGEEFEFSTELMGMMSQSQEKEGTRGRSPSPTGSFDLGFTPSKSPSFDMGEPPRETPSKSPSFDMCENPQTEDNTGFLFDSMEEDIPPEPILTQSSQQSLLTPGEITVSRKTSPKANISHKRKRQTQRKEKPKQLPKKAKPVEKKREEESLETKSNTEEKSNDDKSLRFNPLNTAKGLDAKQSEEDTFIDWEAYEQRRVQTQKELDSFEKTMKDYNQKLDAIEDELLNSDRNTLQIIEREEDMRNKLEELALNAAHNRVDIALDRVTQTSLNFKAALFEMEVKEFFDAQKD